MSSPAIAGVDAKAEYQLAFQYYAGWGVAQDSVKAFDHALKSAQGGNRDGKRLLSYLTLELFGTGKMQTDIDQSTNAISWLTSASKQGDVQAQTYLALCYFFGWGCVKDSIAAFKMLGDSAARGDNEAIAKLGLLDLANSKSSPDTSDTATFAANWLLIASRNNFAPAQHYLAYCYRTGKGVPVDLSQAFQWEQKSAELGFTKAQIELAACYKKGIGIQADPAAVIHWLKKAADQGDVESLANLGEAYRRGYGIKQDDTMAVQLLQKAADQNHPTGETFLGLCYYYGTGVPRDYAKAAELFQKAVDQHYSTALGYLARCYYWGNGVKQDYDKAILLMNWLIYIYCPPSLNNLPAQEAWINGETIHNLDLVLCFEHNPVIPTDLFKSNQERDVLGILGYCLSMKNDSNNPFTAQKSRFRLLDDLVKSLQKDPLYASPAYFRAMLCLTTWEAQQYIAESQQATANKDIQFRLPDSAGTAHQLAALLKQPLGQALQKLNISDQELEDYLNGSSLTPEQLDKFTQLEACYRYQIQ
jgi:TPR repeat protein